MAEKEAKGKEKAEEAKKKGGFGVKKVLLLVIGAVVVFVLSMPVFLYLNGMITFQAPYLVPAEGFAAVDSVLARAETLRAAAPAPAADAGEIEAETEEPVEAMGPPADLAEPETDAGLKPEEEIAEEESLEGVASETAEGTRGFIDTVGPPRPEENGEEGGEEGEDPYRFPLDGANLARLVKVYEAMRPKQVALILNTMPERQASVIMANMKEKTAASVLAELEPKKAARMSELIVRLGGNER